MCRACSKFGFYANSGAVSFKQNSKNENFPSHRPAMAVRPLAADAMWRLGAGDWAPLPPGLANRAPLTPPRPPIHSSTPKSSPSASLEQQQQVSTARSSSTPAMGELEPHGHPHCSRPPPKLPPLSPSSASTAPPRPSR